MSTETTTQTEPVANTPEPAPKGPQKTATITLTATGATMAIVAERKGTGARTYVITTDTATKKSERGMTEDHHESFEAAKAATEKMAAKAVKLGWHRREARRGFVAKADAFNALPAAPKGKK